MQMLIAILVCLAVAIFTFIKLRRSAKSKGKGFFKTLILPVIAGTLVLQASFVVAAMVGAFDNIERDPNHKSLTNKEIFSGSHKYETLTDSLDRTVKFLKDSPEEMAMYQSISAMPEGFNRDRALVIFKDYKISVQDFEQNVLWKCERETNKLQHEYNTVTSNWIPLDMIDDAVSLQNERTKRNKYNTDYAKLMDAAKDHQEACFVEKSAEFKESK